VPSSEPTHKPVDEPTHKEVDEPTHKEVDEPTRKEVDEAKPKDEEKKPDEKKDDKDSEWTKNWQTLGSEKADKDWVYSTLWKHLSDPKKSWTEKIGVVMLTLAQYLYRRRQNGQKLKEIQNSEFTEEMKKIIHLRFNEQHNVAVSKFEKHLYDETKYLGVLVQNSFEQEFKKLKADFHRELKEKNFETFNELTGQFVEHIYQEQLKTGATKINPIF
jgi:hypothetical protein